MLGLPSSSVYSLDLFSVPRHSAGLAKVNAHFYAFGGSIRESCCEKMQLSNQHWTQISSMHYPRSSFTPCHFLLYLASTGDHKKVETFNAETFTVLPVSLLPQL